MFTDRMPAEIGRLDLSSLIDGALDPAGFTERVSNAIAFHGPDPFEMIKSTGDVASDDLFLKLFLHELTHHASFSGALGWTLSSLSASCLAHCADEQDTRVKLSLPSRDLIVDKWLFTVVEPMIEGAALFAEFDTVCGHSPIVSRGMHHALHLALPALVESVAREKQSLGVDPFALLSQRLLKARLAPASVEDKANLLGSSLVGDHGYLLGYLATKSFYFHLRCRCGAVHDPDFFLAGFMKHFFFDEGLARRALRADDLNVLHVQHTISDLAEHLQDRWRDIHDNTSARYQSSLVDMLAPQDASAAGFSPQERKVIDQLTLLAGLRTAVLAVQVFWPKLFKYRHILRYSGRRIFITAGPDGRAELRRRQEEPALLTCPTVPLADKGQYDGTIEAICSFSGVSRAVVVLGETGLVAAWDPATQQWNDPALVDDLDELPPMNLVMAAAEQIAEAVSDRLQRLSKPAREVLDAHLRQAKDFARFLHLQMMLPYWEPDRRSAVGDVLLDRGFSAVFAETELADVARYSIAFGGHGRSIEEVACLLGVDEVRVQDDVDRINERTNAKLGLDMMPREGETITSLL